MNTNPTPALLLFILIVSSTANAAADCMIPATRAQKLFSNNNNIMLIDIRPAKDYQALHIHNSINMPAYTLKHKSFLKKKQLILIDRGHNQTQAITLCKSLQSKGFKHVRLVEDGMYAWRQSGAKLAGTDTEAKKLLLVSVKELGDKHAAENYHVLNLSAKHQDYLQQHFTQVKKVRDEQQLKRILKSSQDKNKTAGRYLITTASAQQQQASALLDYIHKHQLNNVVLLEGEAGLYRREMENLKAVSWGIIV